MSRHSQVVIRAPDGDVLFSPGIFFGERETIGITQYAFENAVGVILLLFGNLITEKIFIREKP
jgi:hypothetical protein